MRPVRIATVAALVIASAWTLRVVGWANREHAPNENAKEQSYMKDEKVLIQAKIQPQRRAELIDALSAYLPLVRAEPGVNAFYVTAQKDDQIRLFFTRSTSRKLHRISICSRIHEEILGDAQERTGSRPRADKSH